MYDDISAEDFLHIQTDTEYRREWDKSAVTLEVIDTDPVHRHKSHIIHWEMQWPVINCFTILKITQKKMFGIYLQINFRGIYLFNFRFSSFPTEIVCKSRLCVQSAIFR